MAEPAPAHPWWVLILKVRVCPPPRPPPSPLGKTTQGCSSLQSLCYRAFESSFLCFPPKGSPHSSSLSVLLPPGGSSCPLRLPECFIHRRARSSAASQRGSGAKQSPTPLPHPSGTRGWGWGQVKASRPKHPGLRSC